MRLQQLKIDYLAEQDRLLMLISASGAVEVRMTLTRRFVKLLWPLLVKLAEEASPRIRTQPNPEARKALLGIEHEQAVSKADFSKPYDDGTRARPLGEAPILLARIQTGRDRNGHPVVALHPAEGQGVNLTLDPVLLHSVCRLLQAAVKKSDWDMELKLPGAEAGEGAERAPRVINSQGRSGADCKVTLYTWRLQRRRESRDDMEFTAATQQRFKGLLPDLLGIELVEVTPHKVLAHMTVRPELCTVGHTLHGGAIMAFADTLGAVATFANLPEGARTTTIESKTNFVGAAPAGTRVSGESVAIHKGRTTMVWQTTVRGEGGKLVALVTQTQLVIAPAAKSG